MFTQGQLELFVSYSAPIEAASRLLRVLPVSRPGQVVMHEHWECQPSPTRSEEKSDRWGNRVLRLWHRTIEREMHFSLKFEAHSTNDLPREPLAGVWKMPSRAIPFLGELTTLAKTQRAKPPLERADYWNRFVFANLRYEEIVSEQPANSSEIWERKAGTCADFTHVFLSLCRQSGLPARYLAGFNPAQGLLHAWGEVWVGGTWHAFDPTHGRAPSPGCIVVAQGRDFYDCPPHRGHFRGEAEPSLQMHCSTQVKATKTAAI